MEIFKIEPRIWAFNNAIEKPQEIIDFFEENYEWEKWYTLGLVKPVLKYQYESDNFPTEKEWNSMTERIGNSFEDKHAAPYEKMILDAFHKTTKIYLEEHNIKLNNYFFPNFDIARYYKGGSMNYHTDYPQEKYFIPEHKFFTTVIMYLNDNYDGGVLSFIEVDENKEILWRKDYKPKAGDVVIFPSKSPIYHCSTEVTEGEKYMIRTYWSTYQEPDDEWNAGVMQYGEEKWSDLQHARSKKLTAYMVDKFFNDEPHCLVTIPDDEDDLYSK